MCKVYFNGVNSDHNSVVEYIESSTICHIASRINLLEHKEEIQQICEVFGQLIEQGYISFTKIQRQENKTNGPSDLIADNKIQFDNKIN